MIFIIYKTTNLVNNKFYIGMHKTKNKDDGYMGSGKLLKRAFKKYGKHNFITEILMECESEEHMKLAEKVLVVIDQEISYNLCPGGKGGFGFVNQQNDKPLWVRKGRIAANRMVGQIKSERSFLKYESDPIYCLTCKTKLEYKRRMNKYCNHSCGAQNTNKTRILKRNRVCDGIGIHISLRN